MKKVKKGGSRASNAVMGLNPKVCMDYSTPVINGTEIKYNLNDLSLYRTTGGGRKVKRGRKIKGGSKASNSVSNLNGKPCNATDKLKGGSTKHAAIRNCDLQKITNSQSQNTQELAGNDTKINYSKYNSESQNFSQDSLTLKGGGSSDWKSTHYSRGSYTAPNMPLEQFKAFTKTGDYIPNESMRTSSFMK